MTVTRPSLTHRGGRRRELLEGLTPCCKLQQKGTLSPPSSMNKRNVFVSRLFLTKL
jgi:hypothetical protein